MRHLKLRQKLERPAGHRRALLRHLVTSLIKHERIETTLPKARVLKRFADRMITWGKRGDLHARRQAARFVLEPGALQKLFAELAVRFKDRQGGYTRIIKVGFRRGDTAPMALVEYLGYQLPELKAKKGDKKSKEKPKKKVEAKPVEKKVTKPKKGFFSRLMKEKG